MVVESGLSDDSVFIETLTFTSIILRGTFQQPTSFDWCLECAQGPWVSMRPPRRVGEEWKAINCIL